MRWRRAVVAAAALAMIATVPAFLALESEFMPPLHEGAILYMPTAPPGMGSSEAVRVLQDMDRRLRAFPEVVSVFGKMGRADTPTDPAPIGMAETVIVLKPRDEWRPGLTWDGLIAEMDAKLRYADHTHARIVSVDPSRARALPGVLAVLTHEHCLRRGRAAVRVGHREHAPRPT